MNRFGTAVGAIALATLSLTGCGSDKPTTSAAATKLVGLFRVTAGSCAAGAPTGSTFRMLQPNGKPGTGPYVLNGDSRCQDKTTTALTPGADGGLRTGVFQAQPSGPFDATGNGTSAGVVRPQKWFAVAFGIATNQTDPQTKKSTAMPRVDVNGTALSGDLSAFAASWNGQHFNQGAPKPGGARPGNTTGPTGSYDPATKAYTLDWSSQIIGGPFNNFTGIWHLEGTFEPT